MSILQKEQEEYCFENKKFTSQTMNSTEDLINSFNFNPCLANIIDHEAQDGEKQWHWGYIAQLSQPEQLQQIQGEAEALKIQNQQLFIQNQQKLTIPVYQNQINKIESLEQKKQEFFSINYENKLSKRWIKKMDKILKGKKIKYEDHNRNMPPFFVRIFSKFFEHQKKQFQQNGNFSKTQGKLQKIQQKKKANLQDLINLLGQQDSYVHRKIMQKIIRQSSKNEIIMSRSIQNKISYLLCSKIYTLRCKSKYLVGRVQSK